MSLSRSFFNELAAIAAAATSMAAMGIYESGESIGDKSALSPGKDAAAAAALGALIDDLLDPSPNPPPFYKRDSSGHFLAICCLHLPPPPPRWVVRKPTDPPSSLVHTALAHLIPR